MLRSLLILGLGGQLMVACSPRPFPPLPEGNEPHAGENYKADAGEPGNSCASAELLVLPLDGGRLELNGSTLGYADPVRCCVGLSCSATLLPTPDHVYRIDLPRPLSLHARVNPGFSLHFLPRCEASVGQSFSSGCAVGAYGTDPGVFRAPSRLDLLERPAGPAFLWVEAPPPHVRGATGLSEYELTVWTGEPIPGMSCDAPLLVPLDGGSAALSVDLDEFAGYRPVPFALQPGALPPSATVCFAVEVDRAPTVVDFTATGPSHVCWNQPCRTSFGEPNPSTFQQRFEVVSRRTIQVSSFEFVPLQVEVRSTFTPPPPGSCEAPLPLAFVADAGVESATVNGDTSTGQDDVASSCAASPYLTYGFTLAAPRRLTARVATISSSYLPAVALRGSTCRGANGPCVLASGSGGSAELDAGLLPAGNYFLWVGGGAAFVTDDAGTNFRSTSGPFSLEVELTP